jgi:glycerol-3-phosphate dehydrogenase (NAD(P)+)
MRLAVVGAGSWGTALAHSLASAQVGEVRLWARNPTVAEQLRETRRHPWALEGIALSDAIRVDDRLDVCLLDTDIAILAVPSHSMRAIGAAAAAVAGNAIVVSAAKGFEVDTALTMTAVLRQVLAPGTRIAALSGPNIAIEVARGLPAATVVAASDAGVAEAVRDACNGGALRFYSSDDVIGVESAGALKNVVAIAAGVCDGIGAGDNGKAALITRGIAEMARLGVRAGARALTFAGLAGLGDCVVTCMSPHSRNRGLGEQIGRGVAPADAIASSQMVVEGVNATRAALLLADSYAVEMPIAREIHSILFQRKSVASALSALMTRGAGDEFRGFDPGSPAR